MISLNITIDTKEFERFRYLTDNIRISTAMALTLTAKAAQAELKATAPSIFHLRNKWIPQGIRIEPATAATLNAKVGSIDKYMARHVIGETKVGSGLSIGGGNAPGRIATGGLLIGFYSGISDALTHTKERALLRRIDGQKRKTFQIMSKGGNVLIVRRAGAKKSAGLDFLAVLKPNAPEAAIWPMESIVRAVVSAKFEMFFSAALTFGSMPKV